MKAQRDRGRRLTPRARRALLTFHIAVSVGLLGDVAAFLALAVRAITTDDPALAAASYELLAMLSAVFGIPLSAAALASGVALGLGGKWGVLRYPWVTAKLLLIVSVMVVGATLLGPGVEQMRDGGRAETRILAGAIWDVAALLVATGLSVYKPGRSRASRAPDAGSASRRAPAVRTARSAGSRTAPRHPAPR